MTQKTKKVYNFNRSKANLLLFRLDFYMLANLLVELIYKKPSLHL